jgi:glutathione S-transferase
MSTVPTLVIANKSYSSWSLRPWLAMVHFNVPFEEIVIPLDQETTSARIREHSPAGKVPILHHGGITVWESLAILDYLAEAYYDRAWWPADPHAKAHARAIAAEMHAGFGPLRQAMPMNLRKDYSPRDWPDDVAADISRVLSLWRSARQQFGLGGPFLFGDFSVADAMYAPVVTRLRTYAVDLDDTAQAYSDAIFALPAMQRWCEEAAQESWVITKYDR